MAKVGSLFIDFRAATASFAKDMGKIKDITFRNMKEMKRSIKVVGGALKLMGAAAAGAAIIFIKSFADMADNLAKLSRTTGLSVEKLSELGFAIEQSGLDTEQFAKRLVNLQRRAKEAQRGVKTYKDAFDALGISVTDSAGQLKDTETLLLDVADAFSRMEDGTLKAALATDIFSNRGVAMIPFLNEGRVGIKRLTDQAKEFGITISTEAAEAAEEFNDSLNVLSLSMRNFAGVLAVETFPALTNFFQLLAGHKDAVSAFREQIEQMKLGLSSAVIELITFPVGRREAIRKLREGLAVLTQESVDRQLNALKRLFESTRALALASQRTFIPIIASASDKVAKLDLTVTKAIAALEFQRDTFGKTARAIALYKLDLQKASVPQLILVNNILIEIEALEAAKKAREDQTLSFKRLADEQKRAGDELKRSGERVFRDTRTEAERLSEELRQLHVLVTEGAITWDTYNRAVGKAIGKFEDLKNKTDDVSDASRDLSIAISTAFEDAIISGERLSAVLKGLLQDILRIIIRITITEQIEAGLRSAFGGVGIGKLLGFRHGGRPPVGVPVMVGEAGREVFVPDRAGTIIPNSELGGGGSSIYVDARGGAPGLEVQVASAIRNMGELAVARAVSIVRDNARRS